MTRPIEWTEAQNRQIVDLVELQCMGYRAAAAAMGVSRSAVHAQHDRLRRARPIEARGNVETGQRLALPAGHPLTWSAVLPGWPFAVLA